MSEDFSLGFDLGRVPSSNQNTVYYTNAFILSLLPVYLYRAVEGMTLGEYWYYFLFVTGLAVYILATGYHTVTLWAFGRLDRQREVTKKQKESFIQANKLKGGDASAVGDLLVKTQQTHSAIEATAFSLALNNAIFLFFLVFFGFFLAARLPVALNYSFAVTMSALLSRFGSDVFLK
eukprot:c17726_g1_i1.p1 GENE.c17726_g1_i1~~c17726_g1_i1.p1  ORF type:complete len:177 (+),score=42.04 c17726_g1_i1:87-617(+)